jgi:hypothetical protein
MEAEEKVMRRNNKELIDRAKDNPTPGRVRNAVMRDGRPAESAEHV